MISPEDVTRFPGIVSGVVYCAKRVQPERLDPGDPLGTQAVALEARSAGRMQQDHFDITCMP